MHGIPVSDSEKSDFKSDADSPLIKNKKKDFKESEIDKILSSGLFLLLGFSYFLLCIPPGFIIYRDIKDIIENRTRKRAEHHLCFFVGLFMITFLTCVFVSLCITSTILIIRFV